MNASRASIAARVDLCLAANAAVGRQPGNRKALAADLGVSGGHLAAYLTGRRGAADPWTWSGKVTPNTLAAALVQRDEAPRLATRLVEAGASPGEIVREWVLVARPA